MIRSIISTIFLFFAYVQLSAIYERTRNAYYHFEKFKDYGGGGHTIMSFESVIFGYVVSSIIIIFGYVIQNITTYHIPKKIIQIGIFLLIIGLTWLTILILSPFSKIY